MNDLSNTEIQSKIYDLISRNPGVYLSKISEMLDIPITIVEQYLQVLESKNIIIHADEKEYKRYYVTKVKARGFQAKKMLEIRDIIYNLVMRNPGLHLSKIAEMLNMRISLAEYHLLQLEQNKRIIAEKGDGYYKRYYVDNSGLTDRDKKILGLLRQEIPLKIVLFLLKNPNSRHKELMDNLNLTTSTLTYHLHKLVLCNIVNAPSYGEKGYSINNRKDVIGYLKRFKLYTVVEYFKDVWGDS